MGANTTNVTARRGPRAAGCFSHAVYATTSSVEAHVGWNWIVQPSGKSNAIFVGQSNWSLTSACPAVFSLASISVKFAIFGTIRTRDNITVMGVVYAGWEAVKTFVIVSVVGRVTPYPFSNTTSAPKTRWKAIVQCALSVCTPRGGPSTCPTAATSCIRDVSRSSLLAGRTTHARHATRPCVI